MLNTKLKEKYRAHVLFVDDEVNILSSLKRVFRKQPYDISTANGGAEALDKMRVSKVDIIVSDMNMPHMKGDEFLEKAANLYPDTIRILLSGQSDMNDTINAINAGKIYQFIKKPWDDYELILLIQKASEMVQMFHERAELQLLTQKQNEQLRTLNASLEDKVKEKTKEVQLAFEKLDSAHKDLKENFVSSVKIFTALIERRHKGIAAHSRRVANLAHKLALQAKHEEKEAQDIMIAALLHDMGKITFSDQLAKKHKSALTEKERIEYKKHPQAAEELLLGLQAFHNILSYIRHHHELYDGTGFPDKLKGNNIPLGAQIILISNDYDNLCNGASQNKEYTKEEAKKYLINNKNKRYHPKLIDEFLVVLSGLEAQKITDNIKLFKSNQIKVGMLVEEDVMSLNQSLLVPSGKKIDEKLIQSLLNYERRSGETLLLTVRVS